MGGGAAEPGGGHGKGTRCRGCRPRLPHARCGGRRARPLLLAPAASQPMTLTPPSCGQVRRLLTSAIGVGAGSLLACLLVNCFFALRPLAPPLHVPEVNFIPEVNRAADALEPGEPRRQDRESQQPRRQLAAAVSVPRPLPARSRVALPGVAPSRLPARGGLPVPGPLEAHRQLAVGVPGGEQPGRFRLVLRLDGWLPTSIPGWSWGCWWSRSPRREPRSRWPVC